MELHGSRGEIENAYRIFEVSVFVPETGRIETNIVTDPYSVALSPNSASSQAVDLDSAAWKPDDWDSLRKPAFTVPEDMMIYELHVREVLFKRPIGANRDARKGVRFHGC